MLEKATIDFNKALYKIGTRIYYTGDQANIEDYGTVTKFNDPTKYSPQTVDIKLDDGRVFKMIYLSAFTNGPGQRFYLATDWDRIKKDRLEAFMKSRQLNNN